MPPFLSAGLYGSDHGRGKNEKPFLMLAKNRRRSGKAWSRMHVGIVALVITVGSVLVGEQGVSGGERERTRRGKVGGV